MKLRLLFACLLISITLTAQTTWQIYTERVGRKTFKLHVIGSPLAGHAIFSQSMPPERPRHITTTITLRNTEGLVFMFKDIVKHTFHEKGKMHWIKYQWGEQDYAYRTPVHFWVKARMKGRVRPIKGMKSPSDIRIEAFSGDITYDNVCLDSTVSKRISFSATLGQHFNKHEWVWIEDVDDWRADSTVTHIQRQHFVVKKKNRPKTLQQ